VHFSFFTFFSDVVIFQVVKWMFLNFHDFQFSCHIPRPTVDISKFSTFFSFPRDISHPKVCISHFPKFSVFSPYSRSYSVHFSFFTFCSDFVIFQVVKWMFLIFHDFQFSCHIPFPTADIPKISTFFIFLSHISSPKVCISQFRDFHFSRHIPRPTVCISHFSSFSVISSLVKSLSGCLSFSMIFSFLALFHVLQWTFLNFPPFSVFLTIFQILKCVFLIFRDYQFSRHIPGTTV
jgi:hypothetical protein